MEPCLDIAVWIVNLTGIYAAIGLVFAVLFSMRGAARVDPAARSVPWSFRLLILPGAAALWPFMLARWVRAARSAPETAHAAQRARP